MIRAWLTGTVLMVSQTLHWAQALPCPPSIHGCSLDQEPVQVLSELPFIEVAPTTVQPYPVATGIYHTELERGGRPSIQPFPTEISYITFPNTPGLLHPSVPHLDVVPLVVSNLSTFCLYKGRPCGGIPHVAERSITDWDDTASSSVPLPSIATTSVPSPATSSSTAAPSGSSSFTSSTSTSASLPTSSSTPSSSSTSASSSGTCPQPTMATQDIFKPIATGAIPSNIRARDDHPLRNDHVVDTKGPISTNKFYANFFLGGQTNFTFTHPYSVAWARGNTSAKSHGLGISHVEADQLAMGEPNSKIPGNPARFYINPVGIHSIILSAVELGNSSILSVSKPLAFSTNVILQPQADSPSNITFPLVQGMGLVTGVYNNLQPAIQTTVFFRELVSAGSPKQGIFKYRVTLEDGKVWLVYVSPSDGADPKLQRVSNTLIQGPKNFKGTIQVGKNPGGDASEKVYDASAGVYATGATISGSVAVINSSGSYKLAWDKAGRNTDSTQLLMFALPHHVESFDECTQRNKKDLQLRTTTKGNATAYSGDSWTMVEADLPMSVGFAPWNPVTSTMASLSAAAKNMIKGVAPSELSQDINSQSDLDSTYFSGKAIGKFATLIYTVHELLQDPPLAATAFETLKTAFARFTKNEQRSPLVYDTVWKGVVSSASYTGDPGLDFGNTYYNDHHFHYGYFIYAAAIMGQLDKSWLDANKDWVNTLVRDAANSVPNDELFPFSRGFDWFHGHSWAKGLFESFDGKDQESTSEDTLFAYAIKMWGKTIGDASMQARGDLMLAILARTLRNYFLMDSKNVNHPKDFIANKVTGILFENKVDHATYFGANLEYIQGIHMLPLIPSSSYTRRKEFVKEEWDAMFASGASTPAERVEGGWRGVLFANLALIDPSASWDFFAQENFDLAWVDGGATRTWYLAFAAGLGGGPK
ncbi:hypothetical protein AJ80_03792 [Polytolypa hystricis UAMH7299]|uniref:glucan endo-1,3-beta-D-glucosidase n=1 Tax=Polytolypa hystricis (strain UAMH7299) TaxID=1447883 RepID=A0A2B7YFR2_POLH7|nr:hypothetical protein AJ80_03792 [Polytolypa hystricis UAMH7299]